MSPSSRKLPRLLWPIGAIVLAALLTLPAGCRKRRPQPPPVPAPRPTKAQPAAPLDISIRIAPSAAGLVEGDLAPATVTVRNSSPHVIVMRAFNFPGQLPNLRQWFGGRYGTLTYDQKADKWLFNPLVQQLSVPLFAGAVLFPGDELQQTQTIRLLEPTVRVTVGFNQLSEKAARQNLYFATAGPSSPMGETAYSRLAPGPIADQARPEPGSVREAVYPAGAEAEVLTQEASLTVQLAPRTPSVKQAAEAVMPEWDRHTYWLGGPGWVLRLGERVTWLSPKGPVDLPACDLLVFDLFDLARPQPVDVLLPLKGFEQDFDVGRPRIEGPGFFNPGYTKVAQADLPRLLARCRQLELPLTAQPVNPTGLGAGNKVVVGKLDLEERRKAITKSPWARPGAERPQ